MAQVTVIQATEVTVIGAPQQEMVATDNEDVDSDGSQHVVGCCACCGCGPTVPNKTVKSKEGQTLRYNFVYTIEACCGAAPGLDEKVIAQIPEAIAAKGLQADVWTSRTKLLKAVNAYEAGLGCCPNIMICIACVPTLFCCCYMCQLEREEKKKWDQEFRKWQEEFNKELEPLGMFVKSQSMCYVTRGGKGEKQRHIHRWLAFALSPAQIAKLKSEPHLFGDIEDNSCCGGVDESELCMHPGC